MTDKEKLIELLEKGRSLIGFSGVSSVAMARLADDLILRGVAVPVRCKNCKRRNLDEVIKRIRNYAPDAHIYVACDTMCLMSQDTVDCQSKEEEQGYIVSEVRVGGMDCGDW